MVVFWIDNIDCNLGIICNFKLAFLAKYQCCSNDCGISFNDNAAVSVCNIAIFLNSNVVVSDYDMAIKKKINVVINDYDINLKKITMSQSVCRCG